MTLAEHIILDVFGFLFGRRRILQLCGCADIPLVKFPSIGCKKFLGRHGAGANEKKSPVLDTQNRQSTYSICVVLVRPDPAALSVSRFLLASLAFMHNAYSDWQAAPDQTPAVTVAPIFHLTERGVSA